MNGKQKWKGGLSGGRRDGLADKGRVFEKDGLERDPCGAQTDGGEYEADEE